MNVKLIGIRRRKLPLLRKRPAPGGRPLKSVAGYDD
jgi:hypothetical protein